MENQSQPKLNWWVDIALFLAAPVLAFLIGQLGGLLREFGILVVLAPLPCGLALGFRVARRVVRKDTVISLLTLFFGAIFAFVIAVVTMVGCSLGGGEMNIH